MTNVRRFLLIPLGVLLGLCLGTAPALANEVDFGSHVVHYSVISTTFLSPEVARAYDVRRSSNRALANVAIMERSGNGMRPVSAAITGQAVNLNMQSRPLQFREVRDGDAIYHLAEIPVRGGEVLDFHLRITVKGAVRPLEVGFRQAFFAD